MGIRIQIGGLKIGGRGAGSWTPQSIASKVLFWGKVSEIAGGQMPNKVTGSSDYLTITGTGLNARYRTPDTDAYRTADTDYCWWKTDASESTCDGNRLIAYDFARTIVKYDNASPYTIRIIAILKSGVTLTTAESNQLHSYFQLPVYWSGTANWNGHLKDNRGPARVVWTAESTYPATLDDTSKTVGWYDYLEGVTKDGSNHVTVWANKLLVTASDLNVVIGEPHWSASGIAFDRTNADSLKSGAFTFARPEFIYMVMRQTSWSDPCHIFDGNTLNSGALYQDTTTPNINLYAGGVATANTGLILNEFHIVRALFNGASSKIIIDANAPTNGNSGTGDMGGFTLAKAGNNSSNPASIEVKEIILRNTTDDEADIYNYLENKYSL